jgi:hypothetical protein
MIPEGQAHPVQEGDLIQKGEVRDRTPTPPPHDILAIMGSMLWPTP